MTVATVAIVHTIVALVLAARAVRHIAMVGATEGATLAASTRRANGMAATAAIFLKAVI